MLDLIHIGKRIAKYRNNLGLTQNSLAEALYVTHQAVSKWEKGKSMPSIDILHQMTTLFHISIDELLDDADIIETDYEVLFNNYPRHIVISKFLQSETIIEDLDHIFYKLNKKERLRVIHHIIHQPTVLSVQHIWHYLNKSERTYLLSVILNGKLDFDVKCIHSQLTYEEQLLVQQKNQSGHYSYSMSTIHTNY